MKIAVVGLGKMGMQIARKLSEAGHSVVGLDPNKEFVDQAVSYGASAAESREDVVKQFGDEQLIVWIMIPADFVTGELDEWLKIAPKGSIFIDGGNTDFRKTQRHAETVAAAGSQLLDVGTSGGVWLYEVGAAMMAGGDETAYQTVLPILEILAKPSGKVARFGGSGAGQYVKMIHNAIEYGMMQSLAEGYRMLKDGPYQGIDLGEAGDVWEHGSVIRSWLNELTRDAVKANPELDGIDGKVAESGECRWTLEVAKELGIALPATQAAFDVRLASLEGDVNFATKIVAAQRNAFGGHALNVAPGTGTSTSGDSK